MNKYKPVTIEPGILAPISAKSEDEVCVHCSTKRAKWVFRRDESWCAYCFLYETDWAKSNADDIAILAKLVESKSKLVILDESNRVIESESDRILSSIVLASLVKYNQDKGKRR